MRLLQASSGAFHKVLSTKKEEDMKKFMFPVLFALVASLAASPPLLAGERAGAISLSPYIGGYTFDGVQSLRTNPLYGFRLGYDFTDNFAAEAVVNFVPTKSSKGFGSVNALSYRLDVLYNFMPSQKLVPYLALGGGGTELEFKNTDHTVYAPTANVGGGLKYFITDSVALRADVRQLVIFEGIEANGSKGSSDMIFNWEYSLGVSFLFGPAEKPAPPVCPPPSAEPAPPVCPPAPAPAPAPKPEPVPENVTMTLKIEFDYDKYDVKAKYHDEVAKVADFMKQYPKTTAVIEGHTDNRGSYKYNIKLSDKRAESVRDYLVEKFGIETDRLSTKGYGYTKPIESNDTAEGRQANRRVDAMLETVIYVDMAE